MNIVLSIMVLAAFGLMLGAFALWKRGGPIKQVLMMVLLAVIAIINVAIWTIPMRAGHRRSIKSNRAIARQQIRPARSPSVLLGHFYITDVVYVPATLSPLPLRAAVKRARRCANWQVALSSTA